MVCPLYGSIEVLAERLYELSINFAVKTGTEGLGIEEISALTRETANTDKTRNPTMQAEYRVLKLFPINVAQCQPYLWFIKKIRKRRVLRGFQSHVKR